MAGKLKLVAALGAIILMGGAIALADRQTAPEAATASAISGFSRDATADLQGYYIPLWNAETSVSAKYRAGNFVLNNLAISTKTELAAFEKSGTSGIKNYAPVMLEFDDVTSPTGENELGQTYYETTERILPDAYAITADTLTFKGTGPTLGTVTFTGKADPKGIKAARNAPAHISKGAVLTGTLTVGDTVIENVELMWYGGE
tara:strand:+ start:5617 stop:6225 length:609 start_codon:yes stop_codon:yes gene_type:complete